MVTGDLRRLWVGEGVSALGTATSSVLVPLLAVTELHAGPAAMGTLTALAWLPWLVIGLPVGSWVDGLAPRRVMIAADVVSAAAYVSVPIAGWLSALTLTQLVLVALVGGCASVFFQTGLVKLVPTVVDDEQLESANARLFGTESAMGVGGRGLAGALAAVVSSATGLLLDAASFIVSAWMLNRISPRTSLRARQHERLRERLGAGVRFVLRDRPLRTFMSIGGLSNFGLTGYATLLVLYLDRDLQLSAAHVAVVLMIGSIGGAGGAMIAPGLARRFGTGRTSTMLFAVSGPSALLVGAAGSGAEVGLTVAGLVLLGACVVGGNVIRSAWRQRYVPAVLLGRVVSASQLVNYGTMPIAAMSAGVLGEHLGVRAAVLTMGGVHAAAAGVMVLSRVGRLRDLPAAAAADDAPASHDAEPGGVAASWSLRR